MEYTQSEILQYVTENDVKFIKLFFTDIFGNLKSISVQPSVLRLAFEEGMPFDASSEQGFLLYAQDDLYLVPDASTLSVLPWRPQRGRVARLYCSIKKKDGSAFEGDMRALLQKTVKEAEELGLNIKVGTKCEFSLFQNDEHGAHLCHDNAGYCDVAPLDKGENVRRDIILTMEQMGIEPVTSHHEKGHGQNQIDFKSSTILKAADNFTTFKNVVTTIAFQDGLEASFAPITKDGFGNGLHFHFTLDTSLLKPFAAGIMAHIAEITAFLNPQQDSYKRLGRTTSPRFITWSHGNYNSLIRITESEKGEAQMVLRSPDPTCNQYLALSLIIQAGLDGIRKALSLPECTDRKANEDEAGLKTLPLVYDEAWNLALSSGFVKGILPSSLLASFEQYVWKASLS